jgi:acetyl esterase/lipase
MKRIFALIGISLLLVACQKESGVEEENREQTILNVAYGQDTAQRMDIYLPANRNTTETKALVLIHGGAWGSGDKSELNDAIAVFRQRLPGYALFNINYRLGQLPSTNPFPTQENDVKAAFSTIVERAGEYRFNKDRLAAFGVSAGAHLAMLQAYKQTTPRVTAIVNMFGPTDMVALYNSLQTQLERVIFQALLGGSPASNAAMYQASSPVNHVSAQSPPTLILHGSDDPVVPVAQATALKDKLDGAGVPVQMVIYPGEGHGWFGAPLADTYNRVASFLNTHNP